MILLELSFTNKGSIQDVYTCTNEQVKEFVDLQEAIEYLETMYYYTKTRRRIYSESKSRGVIHSGYIYCYKERDYGKTYYCQDWVSFYTVTGERDKESGKPYIFSLDLSPKANRIPRFTSKQHTRG